MLFPQKHFPLPLHFQAQTKCSLVAHDKNYGFFATTPKHSKVLEVLFYMKKSW